MSEKNADNKLDVFLGIKSPIKKEKRGFGLLSEIKQTIVRFDPNAVTPRPHQKTSYVIISNFFIISYIKRGLLVCIPTGYGKSNIGLMACEEARKKGLMFVLIVPLKALATEHTKEKWGKHFITIPVTGDCSENKKILSDPSIEGFVMTFEMLFQYVVNRNEILNKIGVVVIDEAHLMGDKERGYRVEIMVMLFQIFYPRIKIVMLSATIKNPSQLASHFSLDAVIGKPEDRPVPLKKFFHPIPTTRKSSDRVELYKNEIINIVEKYVSQYGKDKMPTVLFFCTTKPNTRDLSQWFNAEFKKYGFVSGIHNAAMDKKSRNKAEDDFRSGASKFIFCTTTLGMGLDMPCDVVVLCGETFFIYLKKQDKLIDGSQIVQIMGRAGRGNGTLRVNGELQGHAHLIYQIQNEEYVTYYANNLIDVQSRILPLDEGDPNHLDSTLLSFVYAGIKSENTLRDMYFSIFRDKRDLKKEYFDNAYNWLKKFYFLNADGTITELGKKTCRFAVKPQTALHLVCLRRILNQYNGELAYPTLFALLLMTPEFTDNISVNPNDQIDALAINVAGQFIDNNQIYDIIHEDDYLFDIWQTRYPNVYKAFSMCYHVYLESIKAVPVGSIPSNNNDQYIIRDSVKRIMGAAYRIIGKRWKFGNAIEFLNNGIEMEIPTFDKEILELCSIDGMGTKTAQTFITMGIKNLFLLSHINVKKASEKTRDMKEAGTGIIMTENRIMGFKSKAAELLGVKPDDENLPSLLEE